MSSRVFAQIFSKNVEKKKDFMKIINLYLPFCQQGWSQYFPHPPPRCPMCQKPNDSIRKLRCKIFVCFFLISFPRIERKCISFVQFVYFLREVCLLFNFLMIKFTIMSKKHNCESYHPKLKIKHTSLKKYTN